MNTLKKITVGLSLGLACLMGADKLEAQTLILSSNLTALLAGTNSWTNQLLTGQFYVSQITVTAGGLPTTTPVVIQFFDGAGTNANTYYISNAWFYRSTITTNITSVLTNALGTAYTNIYPGQYTTLSSNAAGVYVQTPIDQFAMLQNTSQSHTASTFSGSRIITVNGLVVEELAGASNINVTIYYVTNAP